VRRTREARLRDALGRLEAHDPSRRLAERATRLERTAFRFETAIVRAIERRRRALEAAAARLAPAARGSHDRRAQRLALLGARLDGNNPEAILQRGYAIVTYGDAIVRDPSAVPAGARIDARVARGTLSARVEPDGEVTNGEATNQRQSEGAHGDERIG
jgi:exodeoxyribonuclease VII large subunit